MATTGSLVSGDILELMMEGVEYRFGLVNRLSTPIGGLSDHSSPYTRETRALAREIGLRR